jgi:hypothetical protein
MFLRVSWMDFSTFFTFSMSDVSSAVEEILLCFCAALQGIIWAFSSNDSVD